MIRPFKNIEELQTKTAIFVGDVLPIRVKQDIFPKELYFHKWLVTELNFSNKTVGLGTHIYPLEDLCKNFEFQKDNKWLPFGVEETSTRPAKFKVGKQYTGTNSNNKQYSVVISAKYRDLKDNKVRVVVSNRFIEEIYTDKDDNERFSLVDDVIKAENEEGEIGF